jgi:TonB-dependent starch-binding outer membrane protein SusC
MKINQFKYLLSICFICLVAQIGNAQNSVSGTVKDSNGVPLPGASIAVKNTKTGTVTDIDGKYSIKISDKGGILVCSFVGMQSQEVAVVNQKTIDIVLQEQKNALDEVVVIGYGTQKKSDLTGSLSGIKANTLMESQTTDVLSAMQGRMAGVQITSDSGEPGGGTNIIVRGQTSINGSSSPLFVIDGVQIDINFDEVANTGSSQTRNNPLSGINPADIESIEVLKDASATAIYGSRGANGVVLVTTKSGGDGRLIVDYTYNVGISNALKKMPVLSAENYLEYQKQRNNTRFLNEDLDKNGTYETPRDFSKVNSSDWQDVALRTGITNQHQLSLNGGSKTTKFSAGLGILDQEGIIVNNDYKQYNVRLKINSEVSKKLNLGFNTNASYSALSGIANTGGPNSFTGITQMLLFANPWDIRSNDIEFSEDIFNDPLTLIQESDKATNVLRIIASANLDYNFTDNFKYSAILAGNISDSKTKEFYSSRTSWGALQNGRARVKEVDSYSYNHSSQLQYKKTFNPNHKIDAMAAFEIFHYNFEDFQNEVVGFENQTTGVNNISAGTSVNLYSTQRYTNNRLSYLGRVNYTLFKRYLLTASIRADGSDKFGANNRWGYFPSAAFAWKVTDEKFMKKLKSSISNLKLRLSYGETGNERIPAYTYLAQLSPTFYASNNNLVFGLAPSLLANPDLKWEVTNQFNAGIDLGLFKNRVTFSADVYKKITTDLLLDAPIPAQIGYNKQWQNIGRIDNDGLEIQLTTLNIKASNFSWKTDFNISFNRNEVKDVGEASFIPVVTGGDWQDNVGRIIVGQPIGLMYGYQFDGIYQTSDFANSSAPFQLKPGLPVYSGTAAPGRMKYKDTNNDGFINDSDRTIIGDSNPVHFGGINNIFTYKSFDLSVFFQWSYGNDIYNASKVRLNGVADWMNISQDYFENRWTPTNASNIAPAYGSLDPQIASSYYVEDGSYLRLKTASLGYTLPKDLTNKMNIDSIKFNLIGNNLLTWTKYTGWDPEVNFTNPLLTGLDRVAYPRSRNFTLSIKATF